MKKRILFINTVSGFASTGKIVANLARIEDYDTLVCYGRKKDYENLNSYRNCYFIDNAFGALNTILFDNTMDICTSATKRLIKKIKEFKPDLIHLHNLHGYYLNIELLFKFLKQYNKPVVYTLHDCFSLTGLCPHFDYINCDKYKTECKNCPYGFSYPFSLFKQNVTKEYYLKKEVFNSLDKLVIVTPSKWMENKCKESILKDNDIRTIYNGVKLKDNNIQVEKDGFTCIGVASYFTKEKGIEEIRKIIPLLDENIKIKIVGDYKGKPIERCEFIGRVSDYEKLLKLYASSSVFINPTLQEAFGLVNVEAQACGIPVITYNTGGSPETISNDSGIVIDKYDYKAFAKAINDLYKHNPFDEEKIKENAKRFDIKIMIDKYHDLYEELLTNSDC